MPVVDESIAQKASHAFAGVVWAETVQVALATTQIDNSNDQALVYSFNSDADQYVVGIGLKATDMDTHATPTLTLNVGLGEVDGTIDDTIISASTVGQGGGLDGKLSSPVATATTKYVIVDVGTAAATAAAGTLDVTVYLAKLPGGVRTS